MACEVDRRCEIETFSGYIPGYSVKLGYRQKGKYQEIRNNFRSNILIHRFGCVH